MIQKLWRPFARRPHLTAAVLVGALVAVILAFAPAPLLWSTRAVLAWDAALAVFIGSTLKMMCDCDDSRIRVRAAGQDEGQHFILILAVVAAFVSILAIAAELSIAKGEHGLAKGLRVAFAFVTVLASWSFVQIIFALHYAHEFYGEAGDGAHRGGLQFPGDDRPDYWDFLHFGAVIGVAAQTADVAFTSKALRRTGTVHALVAFIFNTVVLALTINLLAGLF
jgi:uncharacterized membrane protein